MRMPGRCALALAIGLAFAAPLANAAGLGRITIQSALGQPLRAEVEVTSVSREEAGSLAVRLASAAAFRQANLEYNPALAGLRVSLGQRTDSGYVVRISSPNAVNEPYLDLLLELTSSSGRVLREYTILLDPPALRATPDVVAPAAGRATAPASAAPAPAPAPAGAAPAARAAAAGAAPSAAIGPTYEVRRGDTLGTIAEKTRPPSASLDQMLVALFNANPAAFIGGNMNNLRAGSVLKVPQEQQVLATNQTAARREVTAQSTDFARYRSRLAQAATGTEPGAAAAAGQGRVTTRTQDGSATAPAGDQLKIAQGPAAAKTGDEAVARDRQIKDLLDRVAELERTNQQLQKALELQSKTGAQVQAAAEGKPAAAVTPEAQPPQAAAPSPAGPAAGAPTAASPAPAAAPPPPAKVEAPKAAAPKAPAPAEEPGILASLTGSSMPLVAGLGIVLAGLVGYRLYLRRKPGGEDDEFDLAGEAARGNSLFGQTGGRSVDTSAVGSFNSSFIPAATQVDSTDVDPVAEADVYIAYGREEQAEDILKEALKLHPDRHAARVKLMEILARRGDKPAFSRHAADLLERTGGSGEDWERAAAIGRTIDPANAIFNASAAAMAELTQPGAMTELRLGETTTSRRDAEPSGFSAPPATLGGDEGMPDLGAPGQRRPADTLVPMDSGMGGETVLPLDSRSSAEAPTTSARGAPSTKPLPPADLSELEFESMTTMPDTRMVEPEELPARTQDRDKALDFDFGLPKAPVAKAAKLPDLPDLDLNLTPAPAATPAVAKASAQQEGLGALEFDLKGARPLTIEPAQAKEGAPTTMGVRTRPAPLEETLSRPSLLGGLTALPEGSTRMAPNTDQATVPLIDFDLSGSDLPLTTNPGRAGALTGSQMASQMATKLDLARGYIDLGVRDGARELLEEVMRDGTREQREAAVDLMKQIDR